MEFRIVITSAMLSNNYFSKDTHKVWSEMKCINYDLIQSYFRDLTKDIDVDQTISDWKLVFTIIIGGAIEEKNIAIYKRGFIYPNDKEKEVSIRIPLPTKEQIEWGITDKRRFNEYARRTTDSGFTLIPAGYNQFENMAIYLEHSIKISLKKALYDSITLKGYKIKI